MYRVAINGFGRIGRVFLRWYFKRENKDFKVVAINDIADINMMAHLFKYDSIHGKFEGEVKVEGDHFVINGEEIRYLTVRNPEELPWKELEIDCVLESTGLFREREAASKHLTAGAKKVLISAPAKGPDITIVPGINHEDYDPEKHVIISLASCTTNALTPVVKVLDDNFGFKRGLMTTTHAYTNDQRTLDAPHRKDPRRARAAALSIVPTTTGAAVATTLVLPKLKGKLHGVALRVPVGDGSIVDLVAELEKEVTKEEVNNAFKAAAEGSLKGILDYTEDPIVSVDIIGNPHSSIVDGLSTTVIDGNFVKVLSWYDNEVGYSNRLIDMLNIMAKK
ncbi:MAG: type I glyceraldehyde-3-phosphate dehydrogenase [Candidatus Asgardarchaeia archaeon]